MDGYDGRVTVGGGPQHRQLAEVTVTKVAVGPMDNNAYVLTCRRSGAQVLVDAAAEPETLLTLVRPGDLRYVVTTHRHRDHWQALPEVTQATAADVAAGADDADALPVPVRRRLDDGDVLVVGDVRLDVVTLVGHTPGSIALRYDDPSGTVHLFTGDSLFPGGPGRTTSPADFTTLMDDLEQKVFARLPDDTWVYPGHGHDTTLGAERPHLGAWRARGW